MPAYVRDGGQWVDSIPHVRDSAAWTDENDQLFVRDGGEFKLIYPDPAAVGDLLPVEGLAVTSGPTHNSVTVGWTNPTQPTITPTDIQIRLATLGAVWTEIPVTSTSWSWVALDDLTEYLVQVRYVRRVDGVITDTSAIQSVGFTTTASPMPPPAPDPGGSGGDSIFTGGGIGGSPISGGTSPGTSDGCWWEWKFEILDLSSLEFIDSGLGGTKTGGLAFTLNYDITTLDATRTYQLCYRTACDTNSDTVADTFGDWTCGDPFVGGLNWDLSCAGVLDSASESLTPAADAVFHLPDLCTDENDEMQMYDKVSGTLLGKGSGWGGFVNDAENEWTVVGAGSISIAAPVITGFLLAIPTTFVIGGDHTFHIKLDKQFTTTGRSWKLASIGLREFLQVDESASSYTVSWRVALESGVMTLTSAALTGMHEITVRWDDNGTKSLFIDGELAASDTSNETYGAAVGTFTGDLSIAAGAYDNVGKVIGWNRALSDAEIAQLGVNYDSFVQTLDLIAYYPQGGIVSNGLFAGGDGGTRTIVWDGSTGYAIHTLTDGQTFTPDASMTANVLRVGGGQGGGGGAGTGEGGEGGDTDIVAAETIASAQTATVGAGGLPGTASGDGAAGGNTTFNGRTANGGSLKGKGVLNGGGTPNAGAGAPGELWTGDNTRYGGNGGNGNGSTPTGGAGGDLGGGAGGGSGFGTYNATAGTAGRGGGGGGGGEDAFGAAGGSGTVKIRYEIEAS